MHIKMIVLFQKKNSQVMHCLVCKQDRLNQRKTKKRKAMPLVVVPYFPLKPCKDILWRKMVGEISGHYHARLSKDRQICHNRLRSQKYLEQKHQHLVKDQCNIAICGREHHPAWTRVIRHGNPSISIQHGYIFAS